MSQPVEVMGRVWNTLQAAKNHMYFKNNLYKHVLMYTQQYLDRYGHLSVY